jgi:putative addiction module killer protein
MFQIEITEEFDHWLLSLDQRVRIRMVARLAKLARGLWGDCKAVGGGVTELREHFGAGYEFTLRSLDKC